MLLLRQRGRARDEYPYTRHYFNGGNIEAATRLPFPSLWWKATFKDHARLSRDLNISSAVIVKYPKTKRLTVIIP